MGDLASIFGGRRRTAIAVLTALLAWLPAQLSAQDFSLFEEVERPAADAGRATRATPGTAGQPDFTLIGTTRIGDRKTALLAHRDGTTVSVALDESGATLVPGYTQYQLIEVGSGEVALRYPDSSPCVAFPDQGVDCSSNTVASLDLKLGAALVEQQNPATTAEEEAEGAEPAQVVEENPDNPFARIRARAEAGAPVNNARANSQRFQPRRIPPDDVPPGYRVVSTPFGDRLVEE